MLCEPFVNISLLVQLFDHRHEITVYRWNGDGPGKRLPAPDQIVGGVSLWKVSTILSWAADKKESVNPRVLERILAEQS